MESFEEIEGATLERFFISEATYVDAGEKEEPQKVKGCSLVFDLGLFVIENPYCIVGKNNKEIKMNELVGLRVKSAFSNKEEIRLNFEPGAYISVSMKDKDYIGPEAASYSPKRGEIIVFN